MSSGETAFTPSVIEHTALRWDRMPIARATLATLSGPTPVTTWAKIVFTECATAWASVIVPAASSA